MVIKLTSKNQVTIPRKILSQLPDVKYFEVELKDGEVILRPVKMYGTSLELIRGKMKKLGLKEDAVAEAVRWARAK